MKFLFIFTLLGTIAYYIPSSMAQVLEKTEFISTSFFFKQNEAQKILDQFFKIRTMTGEFVQIDPHEKKTEGTFYLKRPGKVRFSYKNAPIRVIADGKSYVINNTKLDTWNLYQLHQTPMKLFLGTGIDLENSTLLDYQKNTKTIIITLTDRSLGKAKIDLFFSPKNLTLQQWIITDHQNLRTTIRLANIHNNVQFNENIFEIDYQRISMKRKL